ncbi:hypothetical protein NA78x_004271 [Anatilimnocola sp. NA78]|uniref:hypothetical protein n=1 Tax=Anatilimnocola sp. NA78 TaxID=3415683 RepID=UPI003CE5431A
MATGFSATRLARQSLAACAALVAGSFVALLPVNALAQEAKPTEAASPGTPAVTDDIALEQERVASKYARLEELLLKMSSIEQANNPRRAALLLRAIEQSKEKLTKTQLESVVKLLGQKQLKRALDGQSQVQTDLKSLLDLLMSEDRSDRLQSEQKRIKEYIKEVERLIRLQKSLEGQTEGGADLERVSKDQEKLGERTGDLAKKIKENEEGGEQKPGKPDAEDPDGEAKNPEDKPGEQKPGEQKPGEQKPGEQKPGEQKPGEQKPGEQKPGEQKPGEQKPGEQKPSEQKPGEQKPGEQKPGEQKPGEQKPGEQKPGEQKPGEQKPGEQKPGEQKPGEQKPGESGESKPGEQQQQEEQAKQENPARKRLEAAEEKMKAAQKKLAEAKRKESAEQQREAKEELEKAKAELEEILRQLREEEVQRTLAALEARFRKMLEMQLKVYESTRRLDQVAEPNRGDQYVVEAGRLGFEERKIAVEARKALTLLQEEGSSIAFPATVAQMEEDMLQVSERLAETKIDDITVGLEEDIIGSLEELIAALEKAQQDAEQKKQQQQQQQQQQQEQEKPLVDKIAELKMIKSLQERVNKRTVRYSRLLQDDQDVVGQADSADLLAALKALADRQKEIFGITRDIVLEKNK